jgi:SAM-dependent methyltransferase
MSFKNSRDFAEESLDLDKYFPVLNTEQAISLLYRLEIAVGQTVKPRENEWGYIPYAYGHFASAIKEFTTPDSKYLEVGCGLGTKLLIARNIVGIKDVTGLEIQQDLLTIAKSMIWKDEKIKLLHQDAATYKDYRKYDLIYTYEPIDSLSSKIDLKDIIQRKMKKGAILLYAYCSGSIEIIKG